MMKMMMMKMMMKSSANRKKRGIGKLNAVWPSSGRGVKSDKEKKG